MFQPEPAHAAWQDFITAFALHVQYTHLNCAQPQPCHVLPMHAARKLLYVTNWSVLMHSKALFCCRNNHCKSDSSSSLLPSSSMYRIIGTQCRTLENLVTKTAIWVAILENPGPPARNGTTRNGLTLSYCSPIKNTPPLELMEAGAFSTEAPSFLISLVCVMWSRWLQTAVCMFSLALTCLQQ